MARAIDGDALYQKFEAMGWYDNADRDLAEDILLGMPTLTPPNEWVRVDERLPEESDGMVLFTNGKAVMSGYRNHMFRLAGEDEIFAPAIRKGSGYMRVTHWMLLPAPPDRRQPERQEGI